MDISKEKELKLMFIKSTYKRMIKEKRKRILAYVLFFSVQSFILLHRVSEVKLYVQIVCCAFIGLVSLFAFLCFKSVIFPDDELIIPEETELKNLVKDYYDKYGSCPNYKN